MKLLSSLVMILMITKRIKRYDMFIKCAEINLVRKYIRHLIYAIQSLQIRSVRQSIRHLVRHFMLYQVYQNRTDNMLIQIVYVLCVEDLTPLIRCIWGIHLIRSTKEDLNPWGFWNFMCCKYILFFSAHELFPDLQHQFRSTKISILLKEYCR